jgi:hypothetical protein
MTNAIPIGRLVHGFAGRSMAHGHWPGANAMTSRSKVTTFVDFMDCRVLSCNRTLDEESV